MPLHISEIVSELAKLDIQSLQVNFMSRVIICHHKNVKGPYNT